jgi:hypothetical protein
MNSEKNFREESFSVRKRIVNMGGGAAYDVVKRLLPWLNFLWLLRLSEF